jgi:uncharacterized protein YerC
MLQLSLGQTRGSERPADSSLAYEAPGKCCTNPLRRTVDAPIAARADDTNLASPRGFECIQSTRISKDLDTYDTDDHEIGGKKDDKAGSVAQALAQISRSELVAQRVEDALAVALIEASKAQRWDVVAMLAKELEARRLAGSNVVSLADVKRGLSKA